MATLPARSPHTMHSLVSTSLPRCSVSPPRRTTYTPSSRRRRRNSAAPSRQRASTSPAKIPRILNALTGPKITFVVTLNGGAATSNKLNVQEFSLTLAVAPVSGDAFRLRSSCFQSRVMLIPPFATRLFSIRRFIPRRDPICYLIQDCADVIRIISTD